MKFFSTSAQRKGQRKWWVATAIVICGLLAYHAYSAWQFNQVEKKAQIVKAAIEKYPTIYSNITVRALPVKGIVVVEGEVKTTSDLILLKQTIESTEVPTTIYVHDLSVSNQ
jgi:hypothetical protein